MNKNGYTGVAYRAYSHGIDGFEVNRDRRFFFLSSSYIFSYRISLLPDHYLREYQWKPNENPPDYLGWRHNGSDLFRSHGAICMYMHICILRTMQWSGAHYVASQFVSDENASEPITATADLRRRTVYEHTVQLTRPYGVLPVRDSCEWNFHDFLFIVIYTARTRRRHVPFTCEYDLNLVHVTLYCVYMLV
jgi:hypothetical protein